MELGLFFLQQQGHMLDKIDGLLSCPILHNEKITQV